MSTYSIAGRMMNKIFETMLGCSYFPGKRCKQICLFTKSRRKEKRFFTLKHVLHASEFLVMIYQMTSEYLKIEKIIPPLLFCFLHHHILCFGALLPSAISQTMKVETPQISWHNRDRIAGIDFQPKPYPNDKIRLASGGDDKHVVVSIFDEGWLA